MAMTQDEIKAFWQGFATSSEGHIVLSSITVEGNKIEMIDFDDTDYTGKVVFADGTEIRITMSDIDSDGKIKRLYLNNGEVTKYIDCVYNGDNLIRVGDVDIRDIESLGITTTANLQSKNVSPSQTAQTVTYDTNYDGLSSVIVAAAILQNKSITPKKDTQSITADTGNYGLGTVTVEGDENLLPENIKKGVSIFGVEGTSEGGEGGGTNISTVSYDEEYNTTFNYEDTTENTFTPEFGEDGNITTITDSEGNVLNCEYDENGNIIKVGDIEINGVDQIPLVNEGNAPIAGLTSIEFKDSDYNVTATDREGMTRDVSPTFNEDGNITEVNVDGNKIPVKYDQNGVITKVGDVSISGVDLLEMFSKGGDMGYKWILKKSDIGPKAITANVFNTLYSIDVDPGTYIIMATWIYEGSNFRHYTDLDAYPISSYDNSGNVACTSTVIREYTSVHNISFTIWPSKSVTLNTVRLLILKLENYSMESTPEVIDIKQYLSSNFTSIAKATITKCGHVCQIDIEGKLNANANTLLNICSGLPAGYRAFSSYHDLNVMLVGGLGSNETRAFITSLGAISWFRSAAINTTVYIRGTYISD